MYSLLSLKEPKKKISSNTSVQLQQKDPCKLGSNCTWQQATCTYRTIMCLETVMKGSDSTIIEIAIIHFQFSRQKKVKSITCCYHNTITGLKYITRVS